MKSTKTKVKAEEQTTQSITVYPVQQNIMVKYNGVKYNFESESVELPIDVADFFIEKGIVNSTKEDK
jgi:hypothetical protein